VPVWNHFTDVISFVLSMCFLEHPDTFRYIVWSSELVDGGRGGWHVTKCYCADVSARLPARSACVTEHFPPVSTRRGILQSEFA